MGALKEAARKGKGGDTRLGHLSNGDIVFPAEHVNDKNMKVIVDFMQKQGIKDPSRFIVGHESNRKNPKTRLPQFEDSGSASGDTGQSGGGGGGQSGPGDAPGAGSPGGNTPAPGGIAPGSVTDPLGGPTASDPSTGTTTPGIGTNAGNLTGHESTTAVESGNIPGTPQGTPDMNSVADTAGMGLLGRFGQPDIGVVGNTLGNVLGKPIGDLSRDISRDPLGTFSGLTIDALASIFGGPIAGLAGLASRGLTGKSIGSNVVGAIEGLGSTLGTPNGVTGTGGPAPPGADTGSGLPALGGGIGINLDEMLKNRLGGAQ